MLRRGRTTASLSIALAALLVPVASATAADRYAEPGGNGAEPCLSSDPCSIATAINDAPAGSGVLLDGGSYSTSVDLLVTGNTSVTGDPDDPATIVSSADSAVHVAFSSPGTILRDFSIVHDPTGAGVHYGLQMENGLADRISVDSSGEYACFVQGQLYDSFCHNTGLSNQIAAGLFSAGAATGSMTNVTAIADGSASYGVAVSSTGTSGNVQLNGTNVIASGNGFDTGGFGNQGTSHLQLDNSDFSTLGYAGSATGTLSTTNNNISAEPQLAADSLHETPSSPTIDAGVDNLTQLFDIDLDQRIQGNAVDIGADEADGVAPNTTIIKKPPKRTKSKTAKFKAASSEAGSAFRCKLDSKPYTSCASASKKYKHLKPGNHRFQVKATDAFGNEDATAASYSWTIKKPKRHHH